MIRKIEIGGFRSFRKKQSINLSKKNTFIYGENGSGKSSLCKAIDVFFDATDRRRKRLDIKNFVNRFSTLDSVFIEIDFDNGINAKYDQYGHSELDPLLIHTRRLKGFLDYKNLLPIYFYNLSRRNNLFRFFVEGPFSRLRNPLTGKQILNEWSEIDKKTNLPRKFYQGVAELAHEILPDVNSLLKYFHEGIEIEFKSSKTWTTGVLHIEVKLDDGYYIKNYGDYFNEAKLVALAISIYLAIVLKYKRELQEENYKGFPLLILDDIFIGMDLSNRLPLLRILEDKFDDFQILVTTHDKHWYELSQHYLTPSKWQYLEAYMSANDDFEETIINSYSPQDYLGKAEFHFSKNDYPACANYQRKAIESRIKKLIPENLQYTPEDGGAIRKNEKIATDFDRLIKYLQETGLDTTRLESFKLYSKVILNPLSHDNMGSPVFKREVEAVFDLIKEFDKYENTVIRSVKEGNNLVFNLSLKDNEEVWHNYKFQQLDNLRMIKKDGVVKYPSCRFAIISYREGKGDWIDQEGEPKEMRQYYDLLVEKHKSEKQNFIDCYKNNNGKLIPQIGVESK